MVIVVGAGPAGSYTAYCLARQGFDVDVFEEHKSIGYPVQCSGVITPAIDALLPLKKEIIMNKVEKVRFHAPNSSFFDVKIKPDYVFDRALLDKHVAALAEDEAVNFHLGERFTAFERKERGMKVKFSSKTVDTDVLIAADGVHSPVAKAASLYKERKFMLGMQARVKADIEDKKLVEIFLGKGEFGWLIPESEETARVGVVAEKECKGDFEKIMQERNAKFICHQSGLIPLYDATLKTADRGVFLVGDAATQVKASTHGGILYGMIAGQELSRALKEGKDYESLWKERLGKDLWLNLKIRNALSKFSEKDLNDLVELFSQERLKNVLSSHVRDFPSKFLFQLFWKEPRLLKFSPKAF